MGLCECLRLKIFVFSQDFKGLSFTAETAKKLAELPRWHPNTHLFLYGFTEKLNITDFCEFIKRGFCKKLILGLVSILQKLIEMDSKLPSKK